ncbi:MAG: hypothetical protein R3F20_02360 [Planctomycetota bacterium]
MDSRIAIAFGVIALVAIIGIVILWKSRSRRDERPFHFRGPHGCGGDGIPD